MLPKVFPETQLTSALHSLYLRNKKFDGQFINLSSCSPTLGRDFQRCMALSKRAFPNNLILNEMSLWIPTVRAVHAMCHYSGTLGNGWFCSRVMHFGMDTRNSFSWPQVQLGKKQSLPRLQEMSRQQVLQLAPDSNSAEASLIQDQSCYTWNLSAASRHTLKEKWDRSFQR